ncbi:hypothetical protein ACFLZN_02790, partial [Nanoarchaeota archaeon]
VMHDYSIEKRRESTRLLFDTVEDRIDTMNHRELEEAYESSDRINSRIRDRYVQHLETMPVEDLDELQRRRYNRVVDRQECRQDTRLEKQDDRRHY